MSVETRGVAQEEVFAAEMARIDRMVQPPAPAAVYACALCQDRGMTIEERAGGRVAVTCACRRERAKLQRMARCGLPGKFAGARFDNYRTAGLDPSCGWALRLARGLAETYLTTRGERQGLLLTGTCGVGKTHLACALLAEIVERYPVAGRFWDLGDLLIQIKRSYARDKEEGARSEGELFEELAKVDVLVLDDLGAPRVTDWNYDQIWNMISARYNDNRLTVLTTNYPNLGVGERAPGVSGETLGDRIGARAFSRLQEMCRPVELVGADFRRKRA